MADEASPIHLAVSLHAATQEERAALVPAARRWPLDELMDACRHFCSASRPPDLLRVGADRREGTTRPATPTPWAA
jgi:adenine C2-methylase RlmN of 23S rRNA A2503 and tRNA A37